MFSRFARLLSFFLFLSVATSTAKAQQSTYAQWLSVPITVDAGDKPTRLQLWADLHARRGPVDTVLIIRPAVGIRFGKFFAAHAGYAWIPTFINGNEAANEHRIWQQFIATVPFAETWSFQSRTRFEQRFAQGNDKVGLRLRQFVRLGWKFSGPFQVLIWEEIFLGLNDPGWAVQGYDQNRVFGGFGADIPGLGGRLELGYMYNHLNRGEGINNHVLFTQLVIAL